MNRTITLIAALLLAVFSLDAQVKLSPLFSDNMVLQQNSEVPVWGTAKAGVTVKVLTSWDGATHECVAGPDGKWSVKVNTPPAGGPFEITLSTGKGKKRQTDNFLLQASDLWIKLIGLLIGESLPFCENINGIRFVDKTKLSYNKSTNINFKYEIWVNKNMNEKEMEELKQYCAEIFKCQGTIKPINNL